MKQRDVLEEAADGVERIIEARDALLEACEALMAWLDFDGDAVEEHQLYLKAEQLARAAIAQGRASL